MKRILFFMASAAVMAAVSGGCAKENLVEEGPYNENGGNIVAGQGVLLPQTVITASSAETKTSLSGMQILWSAGDEISLFNEKGGATSIYVLSAGEGTVSGEFTAVSEPSEGYMYAVYPAVESKEEGLAVAVEIPVEQTYAGDAFPADYPMAAVSRDGRDFVFDNLATILTLNMVGNASVESISIEANGADEFMAGAAEIDFSGEKPLLTATGSNVVTLTCDEPVKLQAEPVAFRFIAASGTYSGGFTVTVRHDGGKETEITTAAAATEFRPGSIKDFGGTMGVYADEFETIYIIGDGTYYSGWDLALMTEDPAAGLDGTDENGQPIDYDKWTSKFTSEGNGIYTWTGVLAPGTFKFPWTGSLDDFFGFRDGVLVYHPEGSADDPKYTITQAGNYTITLDIHKLTFNIKTNLLYEVPDALYLIGSGTSAAWNRADALEMENLGNGVFYIETYLDVPATEDDGFKFIFSRDTWDGFQFAWGLNKLWQGGTDRKNNTAWHQRAGTYSIKADTRTWKYEVNKIGSPTE